MTLLLPLGRERAHSFCPHIYFILLWLRRTVAAVQIVEVSDASRYIAEQLW